MRGSLGFGIVVVGVVMVATACGGGDDSSSGTGGSGTGGAASGGGGSGGTGTGGGGAAGAGATDAGNEAKCTELQNHYGAELEKARTCDPAAANECTTKVDNALACPCPTMANASKTTELANLADLKSQWDALGCTAPGGCPAVACQEPTGGACKADPNTGSGACRDLL